MSFVCDCGQVYSERAAVRECQAARHSAAAGCELADAEQSARRLGIETDRFSEAGERAPLGATAEKSDDLHEGLRKLSASGPEVTSSQGAILDIESVQWFAATDRLPDSDTTVLVCAPGADEPVWLGYHDGEAWYAVDGAEYGNEEELVAEVLAWAVMPVGPGSSLG
jgi:hypothetical protein